jgi:hypothetical protein
MGFRLELHARDVTLLPETRPAPPPLAAPERIFVIEHDAATEAAYRFSFDGRRAAVPDAAVPDLLSKVFDGTRVTWQHSSDADMRATFRPLDRILQSLNSTPSYQLFLAGFHVGDAIGLFDLQHVDEQSLRDSFRYLVGSLSAMRGKKGHLFFLPDGYIATPEIKLELMANGKLFWAIIWTSDGQGSHVDAEKLFIPYVTPIGFNTQISEAAKTAWTRISDLASKQSGVYGS